MAELKEYDSVVINNPTSEDFTQRFNGEPYTIKAGESKGYAKFVAFHLAKHLSTRMIESEIMEEMTNKDLGDPRSAIHSKISQLQVHDTHERRIALYKILGDEDLVVQVISAYPFKGFIGEMEVYKSFVEKSKKINNADKLEK
mgnify:CR=1 FL=1